MLVTKVIVEFTIYALIVFASMILHELSHYIAAKILNENGSIKVFSKKYILWGFRLELERYDKTQSFSELKREEKVRYMIIAIAPYWLLICGLLLIHYSQSMACVYAGYVIFVFHLINLPLEFINI